jgi:two-component system nitrate/nitrite response regulator NarL
VSNVPHGLKIERSGSEDEERPGAGSVHRRGRRSSARALVAGLVGQLGVDVVLAGSGPEALGLARSARPAALFLDVALPEIGGCHVCHLLRGEYGRDLPIILLSADRTEPRDKVAGLLLGADDYIAKPFSPGELLARLAAKLRPASEAASAPALSPAVLLTPSELRVLRLLAEGRQAREIARTLSIAPKTVSMHIQNSMKKLGVHTRTQAVVLAHQLGLVNGEAPLA